MRRVLAVLTLAGFLAAGAAGCSAPAAHYQGRPPVSYYLSLGDSLSQGVQPGPAGASVVTRQGYPDQLYAMLRGHHPGLRLAKLGCPGETTASMMKGGICSYPGGSQLAAAVRFLAAHRHRTSLITIDIGANDPYSCLTQPSASKLASCGEIIPRAIANLTKIVTRLRQAAPGVRFVGMNYYLPALAQYRHGLVGRALARVIELAAAGYNVLLTNTYKAVGIRVADVFGAFHTTDFGHESALPGLGTLPRNVAAICRYTWECAPPPRGPNQHPTTAGYHVIAHAFRQAGAV